MKPALQKSFLKSYAKLPQNIQKKFVERVQLFLDEPDHPLLRIHELKGDMTPLKSMNITGDYRALFTIDIKKQHIIFYKIGTHSELY
jgi:addiction module RelE/StbE family toxin